MASLGGTALGDIALVPAVGLRNPKGIRGVEEWYISTLIREDFIKEIYDRQTDISILRHRYAKDYVKHSLGYTRG